MSKRCQMLVTQIYILNNTRAFFMNLMWRCNEYVMRPNYWPTICLLNLSFEDSSIQKSGNTDTNTNTNICWQGFSRPKGIEEDEYICLKVVFFNSDEVSLVSSADDGSIQKRAEEEYIWMNFPNPTQTKTHTWSYGISITRVLDGIKNLWSTHFHSTVKHLKLWRSDFYAQTNRVAKGGAHCYKYRRVHCTVWSMSDAEPVMWRCHQMVLARYSFHPCTGWSLDRFAQCNECRDRIHLVLHVQPLLLIVCQICFMNRGCKYILWKYIVQIHICFPLQCPIWKYVICLIHLWNSWFVSGEHSKTGGLLRQGRYKSIAMRLHVQLLRVIMDECFLPV